jgi:hypothetical protein
MFISLRHEQYDLKIKYDDGRLLRGNEEEE